MRSALLPLLCCPRDSSGLHFRDSRLLCDSGHVIPVDDGIPIFTDHARIEPTPRNMPPLPPKRGPRAVDPFVDDWIVNTNGNLYWGARGNLQRYPVGSPGTELEFAL